MSIYFLKYVKFNVENKYFTYIGETGVVLEKYELSKIDLKIVSKN